MNDTFELISRPVGIRLIEGDNLCQDEMEEGAFPIYTNHVENRAIMELHFITTPKEVVIMKYMDHLCGEE